MHETVLIVDDDRAIAQLTSLWLAGAGYQTMTANSGQAALEAAVASLPQAILLDIRMPDMDGFEVFQRLQKIPQTAQTPVIFLSANAHEAARRQATAAGARFFLSKPYDAKDLIDAMHSILDQADAPIAKAA